MSNYDQDLAADTQVELPLWLAVHLAQRDICELQMPSYLNEKFRKAMLAGSEIINLRN